MLDVDRAREIVVSADGHGGTAVDEVSFSCRQGKSTAYPRPHGCGRPTIMSCGRRYRAKRAERETIAIEGSSGSRTPTVFVPVPRA